MTPPMLDRSRALLAANATARGARGAVACTARTAAAVGAAALERGGSAIDAALAAALAETVLIPPKCGLGGELVALVLPAGSEVPDSLLAIGPAAAGLPAYAAEHGLSATGPASVAVPAAPAGYAALAGRSELGLAAAVAPAVALAEAGIAWSPLCAGLAAQADQVLLTWQPEGCIYRPASGPLSVGAVLRLPGLASLLRQFGALGASLFTEGPAGGLLVGRVQADGGILTLDDLGTARAEWARAATWAGPDGTMVHATPAPTYGGVLLASLAAAAADGFDEAALPRHLAAALAERPVDPLTALAMEGTSTVGAVDAAGNAVVLVHSNSFPQFGSGLVLGDYDLVLSNRPGRGFSADPEAPNAVRAGSRPPTTLHAWMLDLPGQPALVGATSGGEHQVEWNLQLLAALLAAPGLDVAEAVVADRWERDADGIRREQWGEPVDPSGRLVGSSHAVVRRPSATTAPMGFSDPRLGGTAVGI